MRIISGNIKHLRRLKGWSQEKLADELEITRPRIGSYEEGRCEPSIDLLIRISQLFHLPVDVLVKCNLVQNDAASMMKVGNNRLLFPVMVDRENKDLIEVVTEKAFAGYLNGYSDPEYIGDLERMKLPFMVVGKHRAFPVRGDSMPPLKEGSFVIGKYVESHDDIKDGHTYVLVTRDEGLVYKRVRKKGRIFELCSDNAEYRAYEVRSDDVLEAWKFVCALNTSDTKEEDLNMESIMTMLRDMKVEMESRRKK